LMSTTLLARTTRYVVSPCEVGPSGPRTLYSQSRFLASFSHKHHTLDGPLFFYSLRLVLFLLDFVPSRFGALLLLARSGLHCLLGFPNVLCRSALDFPPEQVSFTGDANRTHTANSLDQMFSFFSVRVVFFLSGLFISLLRTVKSRFWVGMAVLEDGVVLPCLFPPYVARIQLKLWKSCSSTRMPDGSYPSPISSKHAAFSLTPLRRRATFPFFLYSLPPITYPPPRLRTNPRSLPLEFLFKHPPPFCLPREMSPGSCLLLTLNISEVVSLLMPGSQLSRRYLWNPIIRNRPSFPINAKA